MDGTARSRTQAEMGSFMSLLKRTPLFEKHIQYGGKLIDFGGWELPVQYGTGILAEHKMVRERAGLFDVSHMGELIVSGSGANDFIQSLITNDLEKIGDGETIYSPICRSDGGTVDDLIVYQIAKDDFFVVVNAANTDKDFAWFKKHCPAGILCENRSAEYAQLAVQGPLAEKILQTLTEFDLATMKFFHFAQNVVVAGVNCLASRTGYTGEDGFELYCAAEKGPALWDAILAAGKEDIAPIGLGARDTLRFEAKLPLYGHEITDEITPVEAGLGFFVRTEKPSDFFGKSVLRGQKEGGLTRKLCEVEMTGRGIPRAGYKIAKDANQIGFITTGMFAPTLGKNIALAILPVEFAAPGTAIEVMIRDKPVAAEVKKGIFYSKKTKSKK